MGAAASLAACLTGCDSSANDTVREAAKHTLVIVTTGDADILFPPLISVTTARQVTELIYDYLAEVKPELNTASDSGFSPRLARSWEWSRDSLSIAFRIDPRAQWHDGQRVTSDDIRFTFQLYNDSTLGSSTRSELTNIDSVTTSDSVTAIFWFHKRSPLQFYDAASQMQILPRHIFGAMSIDSLRKAASSIKPVGSGRYRFVRWNTKESIELAADSGNYRGAPKIGRLIWRITPSPETAATMLFAGDADVYDAMTPDNVRESANRKNIYVVSSPSADYAFMELNFRNPADKSQPHPLFSSRELRRAIAMSLDRARMVQSVFDSLARPGIGPTISSFPSTDPTLVQLPYSPVQADKILDSLGWRVNKTTGFRERSGQRLAFKLLVPSSSEKRKRMAVLIQEQLKRAGVDVQIDRIEHSTFWNRLEAHDFDAALAAWNVGTNAAVGAKAWTSAAATVSGGQNYSSYSNKRFDAYVDSATSAMDSVTARRFYSRAYETAIADAPAVWLYEPRTVLGINKRVRIAPLRADAWWYSLADWTIQ